jgi:GMP synthase (glutamine-hydrolysing)
MAECSRRSVNAHSASSSCCPTQVNLTTPHPEFTLSVSAGLIDIRAASLVAEGFARDCGELISMARDFRTLHAEPGRHDLAWRYGIGPEMLDPVRRTAEIGNWLREAAKISSS